MYRSRRTLHPKIPLTALEFCGMLPSTTLGEFHQCSVTSGVDTGVVFYSSEMSTLLAEVTNIQFDGTFYTVPTQFGQLWTIFVAVGRHTLPALHSGTPSGKLQYFDFVLNYPNLCSFDREMFNLLICFELYTSIIVSKNNRNPNKRWQLVFSNGIYLQVLPQLLF